MAKKIAKKKLVHLLITLSLAERIRMHSYVICTEKDQRIVMDNVLNKMLDEAEKKGLTPWPGIALSTTLNTGIDVVQGVLDSHYPQARAHFDNVKDFHLTMWAMPESDPCDAKLMELH
jgi:hypothetical protein